VRALGVLATATLAAVVHTAMGRARLEGLGLIESIQAVQAGG